VAAGFGSAGVSTVGAQVDDPTEIATAQELQEISADLGGDYVLVDDIDLSGVADFQPLGNAGSAFTGTFDGDGYTIVGLTIDEPDWEYVGLFGFIGAQTAETGGVVRNVTLTDVDVTAKTDVGGLAGANVGNITNVTVSGSVNGDANVGGLVGFSGGCISDSAADVGIPSEGASVGGFVGDADGFISNSTATGNVSGNLNVGGFVGSTSTAKIVQCSARGDVTGRGRDPTNVGGFAGRLNGLIADTSAAGSVTGNTDVGGLVGSNGGVVLVSTATGAGPETRQIGDNENGEFVERDDPTLSGGERTEWWHQTYSGDLVRGPPTVVNGTVYLGTAQGRGGGCRPAVYAVDAATGDRDWTFDTESGSGTRRSGQSDQANSYTGRTAMTVDNGTVYAKLLLRGSLVAVDAASATEQWRSSFDLEGNPSSPTLYDGTLFLQDDDHLYWFDPDTGEELRKERYNAVGTSVTAAHGQVYLHESNELVAVDTETGETNWTYESSFGPHRYAHSTVDDETVYAVAQPGNLYAVDAASGDLQWEYQTQAAGADDEIRVGVTAADGTVYVGANSGTLYAVDAATGDEEWRFQTAPQGEFDIVREVEAGPTVADGTVYVGAGSEMYAVDAATGDENWSTEVRGRLQSAPTVVDGTVYFGTNEGFVYALNADTEDSSQDSRVQLRTLGHHGSSAPPTNRLGDTANPDDSTPTPTTATPTNTQQPTTTPTPDSDDDTTAGSSGPGPGILGTVGSLAGAGYLLDRYTDDDKEE
jgi:outer membrane protein assembly factor BamB